MAADPLPKDFEQSCRQRFSKLEKPEITFEHFLEIEKQTFQRQRQLQANPASLYVPGLSLATPCGNGDFEADIGSTTEWQGAYGMLPTNPNDPTLPTLPHPFANVFAAGIASGSITNTNSHQTWVGTGSDPNVGISLTAPGSSQHAVRIGNAVNGYGCELLSKTFVVTAAQRSIKFWYAVVFEDPGHDPPHQPFFWVRVTDSADNIIPGAVNLGGGSATLVSDGNNPFFQKKAGTILLYKDWSCTQINLSTHVGQQVTVEFVTGDCGYGGHYGYAYVDNFCGTCDGSPEGTLTYDAKGSSTCGAGKLCFDYTLPTIKTAAGAVTGSVLITLDIYQNGTLLTTLSSPTLTSGSNYCFALSPLSIPGIDPNLVGFDYVATGNFSIPNTSGTGTIALPPMTVGAVPDGRVTGQNNDYAIQCKFFSYAVKFVCGVQPECGCECAPVRPGQYATEINIYNQTDKDVTIRKRVIPVVLAGAPAGREPRVALSRAEDKITLPAHAATMDDCCRIAELLLGAPAQGPMALTVGFLEIISPAEINVTAVYTAGGTAGQAVSIDVEQIVPKIILI
jgi:hypothetical protein